MASTLPKGGTKKLTRKVYDPTRPNSRAFWKCFRRTTLRYGNTLTPDHAFILELAEGNVRMMDRGTGCTWTLTVEQARIFAGHLTYAAKWASDQKRRLQAEPTESTLTEDVPD